MPAAVAAAMQEPDEPPVLHRALNTDLGVFGIQNAGLSSAGSYILVESSAGSKKGFGCYEYKMYRIHRKGTDCERSAQGLKESSSGGKFWERRQI